MLVMLFSEQYGEIKCLKMWAKFNITLDLTKKSCNYLMNLSLVYDIGASYVQNNYVS